MATNHTANYGLNLWEPEDAFLREEFNENTQRTDAVLAKLNTALNTKGDCCIVTGSYTGDGTYGQDHPTTITFDKPPILVFVAAEDYTAWMLRGSPASTAHYFGDGHSIHVAWSENSVSFYSTNSAQTQMNRAGYLVHYVAMVEA